MSELYDRYRLYFMLERKNERNNQFQHTSHLLSENVLTAAYPVYYTCRYYNAYVYFCPYQENTVHALTYADGTGIILIG